MAQRNRPMNHDPKQEFLLEKSIEQLEKELADQYYQLGKGIYETADRRIDQINTIVEKLVDSKIRLTQTRGQITCADCLSLNPGDNRYCGSCGRELEPDEPPREESIV